MSDADQVSTSSERPRRTVTLCASAVQHAAQLCTGGTDNDLSALEVLQKQRETRKTKTINFDELVLKQKRDLYARAADIVLNSGEDLSYSEAARRVGHTFSVDILSINMSTVRSSISNLVRAKRRLIQVMEGFDEASKDLGGSSNQRVVKTNNLRGASGGKRNPEGSLPSNRLKKSCSKGAANHQQYQDIMKSAATEAASKMKNGMSQNKAVEHMHRAVTAEGLKVHENTCKNQLKSALRNGGIGVSPQKPGGVALPSSIETRTANAVRALSPEPPRPSLGVVPEHVERAIKFLLKATPCTAGQVDSTALLAANIQILDHAQVLAHWVRANSTPKPQNTHITSKNIFNKPGSATGEEALAMLQAKNQ